MQRIGNFISNPTNSNMSQRSTVQRAVKLISTDSQTGSVKRGGEGFPQDIRTMWRQTLTSDFEDELDPECAPEGTAQATESHSAQICLRTARLTVFHPLYSAISVTGRVAGPTRMAVPHVHNLMSSSELLLSESIRKTFQSSNSSIFGCRNDNFITRMNDTFILVCELAEINFKH